ncbi:hypothetical protein [Aridibaculum aurantiacum]|uniref:hypothetical protein n=1 Tax=Aridibaculum aurantiacum TaxID=2810307 RepID=UPI001A968EF8|nr:hypothetical protein [Aridibaculum aurantiacum]
MKKYFLIYFISGLGFLQCTVQKREKIIVQRGVLFLSASYGKILDTLEFTHSINSIYVPDVFIPISSGSLELSKFLNAPTQNGLALFMLEKMRNDLLVKSVNLRNENVQDKCYPGSSYKLALVELHYKIIGKGSAIVPCDGPINLETEGKKVEIKYHAKHIEIMSINSISH